MELLMKKIKLLFLCMLSSVSFLMNAQVQSTQYAIIYDFLDEMAADHIIQLNSIVRPYSRQYIASKLLEINHSVEALNKRQKTDLDFFLNDYALELGKMPKAYYSIVSNPKFQIDVLNPSLSYRDSNLTMRIRPILGMDIWSNSKGQLTKRWYGANFEATIGKNLSIWGSLRDESYNGNGLSSELFNTVESKRLGGQIIQPSYLSTLPGVEYKEADYGGDYSDTRGGISLFNQWGSVSLMKECVTWGESKHSSNIISGRAPSYPMLQLDLHPTSWFQLNYMHAWLVSNVIDSTNYYVEETNTVNSSKRYYRPAPKYLAAMMMTFQPIKHLKFSVGNSVIYSEKAIEASYLIPIAFYKSADHSMTKGIATENQNSQLFVTLSSRNFKHLHLFVSAYVDEVKFARFKPSNKENNPISWQVGAEIQNWPIQNFSLYTEYTRSNIITYEHSIKRLDWSSNSYNLGHYMGSNAEEFYLRLRYKPISRLMIDASYTHAIKYNKYNYIRQGITKVIAYSAFNEKIWSNNTFALELNYEIIPNTYMVLSVDYNNVKAYELSSDVGFGEERMSAQVANNLYCSPYFQGENTTIKMGFSFGF